VIERIEYEHHKNANRIKPADADGKSRGGTSQLGSLMTALTIHNSTAK
jgi:hypothetical protein